MSKFEFHSSNDAHAFTGSVDTGPVVLEKIKIWKDGWTEERKDD